MNAIRSAAVAAALSSAALVAASIPSRAAYGSPYAGVGQHATVMNNIYQTQQRNNAAISHVQNNIRSSQTKSN